MGKTCELQPTQCGFELRTPDYEADMLNPTSLCYPVHLHWFNFTTANLKKCFLLFTPNNVPLFIYLSQRHRVTGRKMKYYSIKWQKVQFTCLSSSHPSYKRQKSWGFYFCRQSTCAVAQMLAHLDFHISTKLAANFGRSWSLQTFVVDVRPISFIDMWTVSIKSFESQYYVFWIIQQWSPEPTLQRQTRMSYYLKGMKAWSWLWIMTTPTVAQPYLSQRRTCRRRVWPASMPNVCWSGKWKSDDNSSMQQLIQLLIKDILQNSHPHLSLQSSRAIYETDAMMTSGCQIVPRANWIVRWGPNVVSALSGNVPRM